MDIAKVDHIGIAVTNLSETIKFYEETLGIKCHGTEEVADQKVRVAFFPVGDTELEFLESTGDDGPIAKFIEANKGRGGIQHVALRVPDIVSAIAELKAKGVQMIDNEPRYGAGGASIAFCHPKSTGGILLELCERN
ncbi:MAG: methylmalonyl-CoA epimerase [Defluviitaleaceae bacterium]|nr:methylmalonyl-CoA epimerase [Defluviitaleaceae bacterium]MCL2835717.1 methylmalonyl-CoA epimerase [Defluviitaleaceae bacterium]